MNVIAINGSPRKEGNTYHALNVVGDQLKEVGIEFEIVHIGNKVIRGCIACMGCAKNKNKKCVIDTDEVNNLVQKMYEADGILIGSPVNFAGIAGTMKSFLDRAFEVASVNDGMFRNKVGAAVVAVRRSGGVVTFDALNHYLLYSGMIISSSNYWNVTHGLTPGEASRDREGNQIMRVLGKNMAWLLKILAVGKEAVELVVREEKETMSFIH